MSEKENKYIDNIVIKLKRKYSKDELVSHLIKTEKELRIENGKKQSEIDELKFKLNRITKMDNDTKSRYCQTVYVCNLKNEIKSLKEKLRKLKIDYDKLLNKQINNQLNQNKDEDKNS